jgi:D-glycero-D-manno-heptose 1,7-bisphosphate phosphatase
MKTLDGERAVFLDRDGVLNAVLMEQGRPRSPRSIEEFRIDPKAQAALERLRDRGFRLIVATNQPEVVRGLQTRDTVEQMHRHLADVLPLDEIRTCFHDEQHGCDCRKPKPGLLLEAARAWGLDLSACFMVGDRDKDVIAGRAAGCRTVLLERDYNRSNQGSPDFLAANLEQAADAILEAAGPAAVAS